jgi:hypothetical protein
VTHVIDAKADLVVRVNRQTLPLYDSREQRVNLLRLFRQVRVGKVWHWTTQVQWTPAGWVQVV